MSHTTVERTNFDLGSALGQVSLVFRVVSSLLNRNLIRYIFRISHFHTRAMQHSPSGRSCLFAKINIIASRISLSLIILCSSVRASSIRSLSAQSTTNIKPCVPDGKRERLESINVTLIDWLEFNFCIYLCSNASIVVEFCPVHRHPIHWILHFYMSQFRHWIQRSVLLSLIGLT